MDGNSTLCTVLDAVKGGRVSGCVTRRDVGEEPVHAAAQRSLSVPLADFSFGLGDVVCAPCGSDVCWVRVLIALA